MNCKRNLENDMDFDFENDEFIKAYTQKLLDKSRQLTEFTNEEELISLTSTETMIIHFYNPYFKKCSLMNNILKQITSKFPDIKFGAINVQNCPKMAKSLGITVLPFLGLFKNGYFVDQLVGFEKLGNKPTFDLEDLANFILKSNIYKC